MSATELVTTANNDIEAAAIAKLQSQVAVEDLEIRMLKVGQASSVAVQNELAQVGSLYLTNGKDDPSPQEIYKAGQKNGVRVHLLDWAPVWQLTTDDDKNPIVPRTSKTPPTKYRDKNVIDFDAGYQMVVALPEIDTELPVTWLLKSTAYPTAKRILTTTKMSGMAPWASAFSVTTIVKTSNKGNRYAVPVAIEIKPSDEHILAAAQLMALIGVGKAEEVASQSEEEVIDAQADDDEPRY
jgi:hypothetical protein